MYSISSRAHWHEDLKQCDEQQQQQHDYTKHYKPPPRTDSLLGGWGWCGRGPMMVEQVFQISCVEEELTIVATKQTWKNTQVVTAVRQKRLLFHHLRHGSVCIGRSCNRTLCCPILSQGLLEPNENKGGVSGPCHLH